MSNNDYNKYKENDENGDSFNISKEEIMNFFGSQIAQQSSKLKYQPESIDSNVIVSSRPEVSYQNNKIIPLEENKIASQSRYNNYDNSNNALNKNDIIKNICHEFIDMFFGQKRQLDEIQNEIRQLKDIMITDRLSNENFNGYNNRSKRDNLNNQYNRIYNQNNSYNYNDNFNYSLNNRNNIFNNYNNERNINELNYQNKNQKNFKNINNSSKPRSKSANSLSNKKKVPETVPEEDEEYELSTTRKRKKSEEHENKINRKMRNEFQDPFMSENPEENTGFNLDNIVDDEFDAILKKGKNKNKMISNDPFKKSSELKRRQNSKEKDEQKNNKDIDMNDVNEKKEKNDDSFIDIEEDYINSKINNKNLGMIDLDVDEMQSDFTRGGKKVTLKLNDDVRKKLTKEISSLDEPINYIDELSKNKKPSNINHKDSKLSSSSILLSKNKIIDIEPRSNNNNSKAIQKNSFVRPCKRNYITMLENSEKGDEEDINKNGSSVKERRKFTKILKKYEHVGENNINNDSKSNQISNTSSQNKKISIHKKIIRNKVYSFTTISSCLFYCLCQNQNYKDNNSINLIEKSKCKICKNTGIIGINNFQQGFYYFVLQNKDEIIEIKTSDSIFKLLIEDIKDIDEKSSNYQTKTDLDKFFNYQFVFLVYDKYLKISHKKDNNPPQIENLLEDIYFKLVNKYAQIFVNAKRSFLTEVSEGDSNLGYVNICLLLMNISNSSDEDSGDKILEFSDGFKSCFATINKEDPINISLDKLFLHNWMNVDIGMSKVLNITEDFKIFMKIYYNSIAPSENNETDIKYGPLILETKKFLPKNILNLRNDGGEISLINVIIMKKYDFYIYNQTKKQSYCRKKYEDTLLRIPESSNKKNNDLSESEEKNNRNNINIKEPDSINFNFKAIAMDFDIYNSIKKGKKSNKNLELLLKKRFTIEFYVRCPDIFEIIQEGKIYQLAFLNLENKNSSSNNKNDIQNSNKNKKKFYNNYSDNNIQIRFNDKSQVNENPLKINYKQDEIYIESIELINKNLNLTNNIDIGQVFVECQENNKPFDNDEYYNKEFLISGIYSGFVDKYIPRSSSDNNEIDEANNEDKHLERYIFLSLGKSKIAFIKLHRADFFSIDVNSNLNSKIFQCKDVIFKEMIYFDNDNDQPKLTGQQQMKNSIPIIKFETNNYSSINFGFLNKNKEQYNLLEKYRDENKELVDMIIQVIS